LGNINYEGRLKGPETGWRVETSNADKDAGEETCWDLAQPQGNETVGKRKKIKKKEIEREDANL